MNTALSFALGLLQAAMSLIGVHAGPQPYADLPPEPAPHIRQLSQEQGKPTSQVVKINRISAGNTGGMNTYISPEHGYKISYPASLNVMTQFGSFNVQVSDEKHIASNTISISVNANTNNCLKTPPDGTYGKSVIRNGSQIINGVVFTTTTDSSTRGGYPMSETEYAAVKNSKCYQLKVSSIDYDVSKMTEAEKQQALETKRKLDAVKDTIIGSFSI